MVYFNECKDLRMIVLPYLDFFVDVTAFRVSFMFFPQMYTQIFCTKMWKVCIFKTKIVIRESLDFLQINIF